VVRKPAAPKAPPSVGDKTNLRALLGASKTPSRVLGDLEKHLLTRPLDRSRSTTVLHPSEIIKDDWCLRASWFLLNGHVPAEDKVKRNGLRMELIFAEGHAIHAKWQQWFRDMGRLYGVYSDGQWGYGEDSSLAYKEVPLGYKPLRLGGHADGWLVGFQGDLLLEIKSIGTGTIRYGNSKWLEDSLEKSFKNIRRPFDDHIKQANVYVEILRLMYEAGLLDREPPKEILFIYECKANQEPKEFVVEADVEMISGVFAKVRWLLDHLDSQPVPCSNKPNSHCAQCAPFESVIVSAK
jgi:hypothetical protein